MSMTTRERTKIIDAAQAIESSFVWANTEWGHEYWEKVVVNLRKVAASGNPEWE